MTLPTPDPQPEEPKQGILRWLWDRGLAMYGTAILVIVSAVAFEATQPEAAPDWLTALATTAGGAIFVRASMRAGPQKTGDKP